MLLLLVILTIVIMTLGKQQDASGMSTYAANFFWHDVRPNNDW